MASTPALPGEDDEPIFSLAEDCEAFFQQEISRLESEESKELRLLEEHQQRFTAWTAYMGVFAKRSLCLDRKLRHHPDLQDLVLRLLDILKTNLSYILDTQNTPEPEPSEEFSAKNEAESSPQVVDKDALEAIDGAIDRLNRLGVAIRQSSTRRLTARGTTKVSGFHSFKELATLFVKTTYPGATYELQDQLGKSMAERFDNVISSQSQHAARGERRRKTTNTLQSIAEDMEFDEEPAADVPVPEEAPAMNEAQYHRMMTERTGQSSLFQRRHDARGRRSEASMSSIDRQVLQQKMSGQSNIGSQQQKKKKETSSIQINQVGYPKAPQVKNNPNRITCEWCFETKEQKFFEGDEWRKHVDNDLKPYLCISENCAEPTCSFTTFNKWKEHMLAQHGVMWHQDVHPQATWVCAVCHDPSEGFQSPQALYSHMENAHHFTEAQLEAIVTQSKVQGRRRPDICPLCFLHVEEDPSIASKPSTARELVRTDAGKRQHEPPIPESTPKRVRTGSNVGQTSPREPDVAAKARSNDELTEAGDRNSSRIDLMARHVAAHLQGLMFLTIRLMSLHNNDSKSVSIASSSADSGDASTRKITSPGNSEPEAESPMSIWDQESIEDRDESEDGADDIPDSKSDTDWSRVIQSNKQLEGPEALGGLLHLSHPDDMDLALIKYHFPDATKTVQIHLARSTTIRRRKLLDQRHHQAWLTIDRRRPPSIQEAILDTGDEPFNRPSTRRPSRQMELVPGTTDSYNRTNPTYTSAPYIDNDSKPSSVIYSTAPSVSELDDVVYPQPVRVSEKGAEHVFCQYCGRTFPSSLLLNSSWWRSHVTEDVQPYVCLFSRCSFLFFSEYLEWAAHMDSVHSPSWIRQLSGFACPLQDECHTDGKTIPHFEDPETFARHIETNHKAYVEATFRSTADAVAAWSQPEGCCPLCKNWCGFVLDGVLDPAQQMALHIANHLKLTAFRLRLLPYGDGEIEDVDSKSVTNMEADRSLRSDDLDDMSLPPPRYFIHSGRSYTERSYTDPVLQSLRGRQSTMQWGEIELPIETSILAELIVGSYAIGVFDNPPRVFLPQSFLSEFITKAAVAEELEENLDIDNNSGLINFIVDSAKKVFATAIISAIDGSNLYMLMKRFQETEFDDGCLPLKRDTMLALPCFQGRFWNKLRTHKFLQNQWVFLAPIFSKSQFKIELEPEHIFPFTWVSNDAKEGTFSNVYQATIHESHQKDPTWTVEGHKANVAIKEIKELEEVKDSMHPAATDEEEVFNKEWEAEARALGDISSLNHRNIVQCIAAIKRGKKRYFMFQWADGGSLGDFWKDNPRPNLDPGFIKEVVLQLRELADALHELHNYKGSYRHGDLKPENILRFKDATRVGVLKIAGMGLAKHHTALTYMRPQRSTPYGTVRYEPPEVVTHKASEEGRSRLYDIWSIGCITLEFIVWLLYGYHDLVKFNDSIKSSFEESSPYFKVGNGNVAQVHPVVQACMDHIFKDPECTGNGGNIAIRDLLDIVKTNLLVVHLPQHRALNLASIGGNVAVTDTDSRPSPTYRHIGPTRATAFHFRKLLDDMIGKGKEDERYWFTGISRENLKGLPSRMISSIVTNDFLSSESANRPNQLVDRTARMRDTPTQPGLSAQLAQPSRQNPDYAHPPLSNLLEFPVDNSFADSLFNDQKISQELIQGSNIAKLCGKCSNMDFWLPRFRIDDTLSELEQNSANCDFCKFRWQLCKDLNLQRERFSSIQFDRRKSMLRMSTSMERDPPVLSICRSPDPKTPLSMLPIQIGLPQLPAAGSDLHLRILRLWLKHCDENHPRCRPPETAMLPTRLIDVGASASTTINLYETQKDDTMKYIALSHPWGAPPHFCTFTSNIEEYKQSIDFTKLPITFQNAVSVTRELGHRYLWIDSICIIQGPDGDFNKEAMRMEDVFSSAHCVIAASSAKGQNDGFLKKRDEREHLTFIREGLPPFHICSFIDDFDQHVLEGSLNKRGWVLQERALARRTIYFTNKQTYWECGGGVRCETLTKMHNNLASLVGDPNFPEIAIKSSRSGKIRLYQALYTHYSRLKFTRYNDRPIAIAGLEKRLIRAFDTRGGFGVFDDGPGLLHRSLLWSRGSDEVTLDRITLPADSRIIVPTWSWMAFKGGIDYLELPFDGVDWEKLEIRSPWTPGSRGSWHTGDQAGVVELSAIARDFDIPREHRPEAKLIYDRPPKSDGSSQSVKCVVVGRRREGAVQSEQNRMHYVLLVTTKASQVTGEALVCERVGVGHFLGRWIRLDQPGTPVKIR